MANNVVPFARSGANAQKGQRTPVELSVCPFKAKRPQVCGRGEFLFVSYWFAQKERYDAYCGHCGRQWPESQRPADV